MRDDHECRPPLLCRAHGPAQGFLAFGIEAGEDPAAVAHDLTTLEGWHRISRDMMFSILPVRAGRHGHGPDGADDAPAAPAHRTGGPPTDTAQSPPVHRAASAGDAAAQHAPTAATSDSPTAHQLAAQTLGAAMNHASLNVANALGAWLGGLVIAAGWGYRSPAIVGVALSLGGLLVLLVSWTQARRAASAA